MRHLLRKGCPEYDRREPRILDVKKSSVPSRVVFWRGSGGVASNVEDYDVALAVADPLEPFIEVSGNGDLNLDLIAVLEGVRNLSLGVCCERRLILDDEDSPPPSP